MSSPDDIDISAAYEKAQPWLVSQDKADLDALYETLKESFDEEFQKNLDLTPHHTEEETQDIVDQIMAATDEREISTVEDSRLSDILSKPRPHSRSFLTSHRSPQTETHEQICNLYKQYKIMLRLAAQAQPQVSFGSPAP